MATKINRSIAILNALADPATVNAAIATRVADAFVYTYRRDLDPATLTNEQKAGIVLLQVRRFVQDVVRDAEISRVMEATRIATTPSAVVDLGTDGAIP